MTHRTSIEARFWPKVQKTPTCWIWTAGTTKDGYGRIYLGGGRGAKRSVAHRVAYELLVGSVPDGMVLDHLCRVTSCVNPDHLEVVTVRENTRRGTNAWATAHRTGTCHRGHSLAEGNYYVGTNGSRTCKECSRILGHERYLRRLAAVAS